MSILEDLRREIEASGLSLREIERQTGVSQGNLSRFVAGESLGMGSAEKVCELLGLKLRKYSPRTKRRK